MCSYWDLFQIHFFTYWTSTLFFTVLDWFSISTSYIHKFTWHHRKIEWNLWLNGAASVLFNQFVITLPLSYLICDFIPCIAASWNLRVMLTQFAGLLLIEEVLFYYIHRLLHSKWLFENVHYFHHQWREPYAVMALSSHPLEHLFSNALPLIIAPWLLNTPSNMLYFWIGIATLNAVLAHSGYYIFFKPTNGSHDLHHRFRNINFGVLGILDYIHGTVSDTKSNK